MMTDMETLKRTNPEQYNAYQMIANTHNSFFLTGKAGTGKTTFLKQIQKDNPRTSFCWLLLVLQQSI